MLRGGPFPGGARLLPTFLSPGTTRRLPLMEAARLSEATIPAA